MTFETAVGLGPGMGRRGFLKRSAAVAGGALVSATTLQTLSAHAALAGKRDLGLCGRSPRRAVLGSYGELTPVADQNGDEILALPEGFRYVTFSKIGDVMSDGNPTPRNHDGMCAFPGPDGTVRLIRNHEVRNAPTDRVFAVEGPIATRYDTLGVGGTVTVNYDPNAPRRHRVVSDFISLNGTIVNCAGGYAPARKPPRDPMKAGSRSMVITFWYRPQPIPRFYPSLLPRWGALPTRLPSPIPLRA